MSKPSWKTSRSRWNENSKLCLTLLDDEYRRRYAKYLMLPHNKRLRRRGLDLATQAERISHDPSPTPTTGENECPAYRRLLKQRNKAKQPLHFEEYIKNHSDDAQPFTDYIHKHPKRRKTNDGLR